MSRIISSVLFDLDGTLADSAGDIIDCLNRAFIKVTGRADIRVSGEYIGFPVREIAERLLPGADQNKIEALNAEFRSLYDNSGYPATVIFPGAKDVLARLASGGYALYLVTNKPRLPTTAILRQFGLSGFKEVVCPDSAGGGKMTKTEMILYLMAKHDLAAGEVLMVGDSEPDAEAARNTGISFAAAFYGYGDSDRLRAMRPDFQLENIADLCAVLPPLARGSTGANRAG